MRRLAPFCSGFAVVVAVGCSGDDSGFVESDSAEQEITAGTPYTLIGVQSNKCVQFANSTDLAEAQITTCDGSTRQQWRFESAGGGYYLVRNVASTKCLDVEKRSTTSGARIIQWSCNAASTNQQWQVVESGGTARLVARHSSMAASVYGSGTANGTRLVQSANTGASNQQFRPTLVGSGGTGGTGGTTGAGGTTSQGGTSTQGGTTSQGGTSSGGTGGRTSFPCDGNTSGYNATVVKSGSTWTAKRGTTTLLTTSDMRAAIQAGLDGLTAGRTTKHSVLVQGDGSIAANMRVNVPSYTIVNVCGAMTATGTPSGDNAPLYANGRTDIEIPNVTIRGTPSYGLFFRRVNNLRLGKVDIRVSSGLGVRIDHGTDHSQPYSQNIQIDNVYVEGTGTQGVETYGVNNLTIGTVVARNVHDSGLLLNQTTNATIGTVDANNVGTGTGYAAFRMANRNGRINNAYPTNIRVGQVIARGGGRGIFCVSESGGAVIDRIDIQNAGNNSILIENCYNVTIAGQQGSVSGGGEIRLAARTEFPNSSDIFLKNLTLTNVTVRESPCAINSTFQNLTLVNSTTNICP